MSVKKDAGFDFEDGRIIRRDEITDSGEIRVSSETEERRALESYRETRARKKAVKRTVIVVAVIITAALIIFISTFFLFRITKVEIGGSDVYSSEELEAALKLDKTSNLIFTDSSTLEQRLRKAYPSLDKISIKKSMPDKLVITVTDGVSDYYINLGGDYCLLTADLKVQSSQREKPEGYTEILLCDIESAVVGETVKFKTDTFYDYLLSLLDGIREHGISDHIVKIDVSKKFDIILKYDDSFLIYIGDADNIKTKLNLLRDIISTNLAGKKGIIYAYGTEEYSFKATNDID